MKRLITCALTVCLLAGCTADKKDDNKRDRHRDSDDETVEEVEKTEDETTTEESETSEETEVTRDLSTDESRDAGGSLDAETSISYEYEEYYIQTINEFNANYWADAEDLMYNLIQVDDDGIPELVIARNGYFVSLYSFADGEVHTLMDAWPYGAMGNVGYMYCPRENALYNSNSDYAGAQRWETFFSISEDHSDLVYSPDSLHYQYFPEGVDPWSYQDMDTSVIYYYVNDQEVSEEEYNSHRVDAIYRVIEGDYSYNQIMEFLTSDAVPATSYYSLVMSDCTWLEAAAACEAAGGHLATLNEGDAYYVVNQLLETSDHPNAVVYVGGSYDAASGEYLWTTDGSNDPISEYYWRAGEPSYTGGTEDGRTVDEPYMCFAPWVHEGYNTRSFMDVPNDTLDAAPSYSGNLGYILEIEY